MPELKPAEVLAEIAGLLTSRKPSRHTLFTALRYLNPEKARADGVLDALYVQYQAAMHATRVLLYQVPHLDRAELRMIKLRILADDDGIENGDSHQFQLRRTWEFMLGRDPKWKDSEFGELDLLIPRVSGGTRQFIETAQEWYPKSLGPMLVIELLAHDWIGALLTGLEVPFPGVAKTPYFVSNYSSEIEVEHSDLTKQLVSHVLEERPELGIRTIEGVRAVSTALDGLWNEMEALIRP